MAKNTDLSKRYEELKNFVSENLAVDMDSEPDIQNLI